ncbi:MAG: hypothetical protein GC190_03950 [Alphaproteobacteria bacterium]|nr:hypothetical protein [Alphaproteobacteria bacterium]
MLLVRSLVALCLVFATTGAALAETSGSKAFVARPRIGAARPSLPSQVTWQASANGNGRHLVSLTLLVDASSILRNIKALSAAALNKSKPCGDLLRVKSASAKLISATALAYDLSFHYAKRVCAPNNMSLDLPAEVSCKSIIVLSGAGTHVTVDIRGASRQPCLIDGAAGGVASFASRKVFKRHVLDLTDQLPPEFAGVDINLRSIAFEVPSPRLRLIGEAVMSDKEFTAFTARLNSVRRSTNR